MEHGKEKKKSCKGWRNTGQNKGKLLWNGQGISFSNPIMFLKKRNALENGGEITI